MANEEKVQNEDALSDLECLRAIAVRNLPPDATKDLLQCLFPEASEFKMNVNRYGKYQRSTSIVIFPKVSNALYYADQDRTLKLDRNLLSIRSLVNSDPATDKNEQVPPTNSPKRESSHHDKDNSRDQQNDHSRSSSRRSSTPSHVRDGHKSLSPSHRRKSSNVQANRSASHRDVQTSRSASHRDVQTSRSASHRDVQTSRPASHRDVQTSRSASHRDVRTSQSASQRDVQTSRSASHRDGRSSQTILLDDRDHGSSSHRDPGIRSASHRDPGSRSTILLDDHNTDSSSYRNDQGIRQISHQDISRSALLLDDLSRSSHLDERSIRSMTHRDELISLLPGDQDDHDSRPSHQAAKIRRPENRKGRSDNERRILIKNLPLSTRVLSLSKFIKNAKNISIHQDELKESTLIGIVEFYTAKEAAFFLKDNKYMRLNRRMLIIEPYVNRIGIGSQIEGSIPDHRHSPPTSYPDRNNSPSHHISQQQSQSSLFQNPSDRYIDNLIQEEHAKLSDKQSTSQVNDIFNQFKDHAKKFATENPDSARALNELLVALGHTSKPNPDPSPLDDLQKAFNPQNKLSVDAWDKGDLEDMSLDYGRNFERENISDVPKLAVLDQIEDLSQNLRILSQLSKLAKHLKTDRYDSDDAAAIALSTLEKLTSQSSSDPLPDDSRKPPDNYYHSAESSSFQPGQKCISFDYNHQKPGKEIERRSASPSPYRMDERSQDRYGHSPNYKKRPREEDYESDHPSVHRTRHDERQRDDPRHQFDASSPNDWYEDSGWREESRRSRDDVRGYSPRDMYERDRFLHDDDDGRLNRMREMRRRDDRYDDDDDGKLIPYYDHQFDEDDDYDDDDDDDDENKPIGWRYYTMGVKGRKKK